MKERFNGLIISVCILGTALSVVLSKVYFDFSYFEPDTVSYLFQAKLFSCGKICLPEPLEYGFSSSPHINILNGKWYSKYPFGNALMLMLGVFVNVPWLIPALVTGLALYLLYLIVRETYGIRIAIIAIILGLVSPATLGMGCNWFSESVSRFYLAIYMLALIRMLKRDLKTKRWALLSGFALGYAFNTRPMSAVAFGIAGAGLAIYWTIRSQNKIVSLKELYPFFVPFAFMIGMCMAWNAYFTGNPLKFTHNAAQPYDKIGFGKRAEGYEPDLEHAFVFTPGYALERIWRHTLPCISFNTLGWGYYRPNLFRSYHSYTDSVVAGLVAKSPADNNWVTLKFWGHGDGTGQIQFQTRGNESSPGLTGNVPSFSCSGGRVELTMRIVKQGDRYTGYFKIPPDKDWIQAGPTTVPLKIPLELGVYAGIATDSGNMRINYSGFRINSDSNVNMPGRIPLKEGFANSAWRWSKEPKRWEVSSSGLSIDADINSNLFSDDQASRFYQLTDADTFDVETQFITDWRTHERFLTLRVIPLAFPIVLMLIPLFHPSRSRYDVFFLLCFLFNILLYFFFYFDGSTWGITPVNARYYTECTLLGIIPLIARGMFIFYKCVRKIPSKFPVLVIAFLLALLSLNTVHTFLLIGQPYRNWSDVYQRLPKLVRQQNIHHAVIFIPYTRDAPIGDYPFKDLEDADIIYFRLGPSKVWGLNSSNWHNVYKQYFRNRYAYIYQDGILIPAPLDQFGQKP